MSFWSLNFDLMVRVVFCFWVVRIRFGVGEWGGLGFGKCRELEEGNEICVVLI